MLTLDHIAYAAETLEEGCVAVEEALGVALLPGGEHTHFATHNRLLGLADGLYLEVIAINPAAQTPDYPRWFDLDRFTGPPRLSNWISRTSDLAGVVSRFPNAGRPVALARGDLRWQMAVPDTGVLPFDNMFPAVIEWNCTVHPAQILGASGCRLKRLVVSHPQAEDLRQRLAPVFSDPRVVFEPGLAGLMAEIETPGGLRVL